MKIGFVGIGKMGLPMVGRLRGAGHDPILFDVGSPGLDEMVAAGVRSARSAADLGAAADIVFVSVPTPEVMRDVALELADGGMVRRIVDLSTSGPEMSAEVAAELANRGIAMVDSPVSGGVIGASKGTLALMVGAAPADLDAVRPLLDLFGRIFHVGPAPGMGQMMKVINNLMSAAALSVSSEAITMAVKAGLDAETVVDVLNAGSGRNSATLDKFPRQILPGTFDAGFAIGLMLKDVRLALRQADRMGLSLPASRAVAELWEEAAISIGPEEDFTRIVEIAERPAGVVIRRRANVG